MIKSINFRKKNAKIDEIYIFFEKKIEKWLNLSPITRSFGLGAGPKNGSFLTPKKGSKTTRFWGSKRVPKMVIFGPKTGQKGPFLGSKMDPPNGVRTPKTGLKWVQKGHFRRIPKDIGQKRTPKPGNFEKSRRFHGVPPVKPKKWRFFLRKKTGFFSNRGPPPFFQGGGPGDPKWGSKIDPGPLQKEVSSRTPKNGVWRTSKKRPSRTSKKRSFQTPKNGVQDPKRPITKTELFYLEK